MCGRYYIGDDLTEAIEAQIIQMNRAPLNAKMAGEMCPADVVPVLASSKRRVSGLFAMSWGYVLADGRRVINARSETAGEKALFRAGMDAHRCAVPFSHYFEWRQDGRKRTKYRIEPDGGGRAFLAGIYRPAANGAELVILTRSPSEEIAFIHDRMPVMLSEEIANDWISPDRAAGQLLTRAITEVRFERLGDEQMTMRFL